MSSPKPSPNRGHLEQVAGRLGPLVQEVVFVGGQVAELLVTDAAGTRVRPTDDVDVVVAATNRTAYHEMGEALRAQGFREDTRPGAPLCRWRGHGGLTLDVMPINEEILGFTNRWYRSVLETAMPYGLSQELVIRIASAPTYIATKFVAFDSRGGGDHFGSHDIEDIITVIAGRPEVVREIRDAQNELADFLAARIAEFLAHPDGPDAIEGALPDARYDGILIERVRERFEAIARIADH